MSEILHKTFKVLLGSGEGVGWSAPTPSSPHSLPPSLANTLKHLALVTPREEGELVRRQIDQCTSILNSPDSSTSSITECIVRMMFLHLMGHDVSSLHIHAVKLAQASSLLQRKLGYLSCSILLPANSNLRIMLTNSLIRDLTEKSSIPSLLVGLVACCNLVKDASVLSVFIDRVQQLVQHNNYLVRTKALITLGTFCDISAGVWNDVQQTVIAALSDQDPNVVSCAIQIISNKLVCNSSSCVDVLPPVLHVYKQIHEGRFPPDFIYKGMSAPWTQVYIIRCLAKMNSTINGEARSKVAVRQIFQNILSIEFSKETIVQVVLSECIIAVTKLDALSSLLPSALKIVSKFLQSKNNQVKYCGLDLLKQIFTSNPPVMNSSQEDNVIFCLEHPDLSIQIKTFNLLITITNQSNCNKIMNSILTYIKKTVARKEKKSCDAVEEQIDRIYKVIMKHSQSLDWTVEALLRLIQCSKGRVQRNLLEHLKLILSDESSASDTTITCDNLQITDNFQSVYLGDNVTHTSSQQVKVQANFSKLIDKLIQTGVNNAVIIELYVWKLGYFANIQSCEEDSNKIIEKMKDIGTNCDTLANTNIMCQACWAILDIRRKTGFLSSKSEDFLKNLTTSKNMQLRRESKQIIDILKTFQTNTEDLIDLNKCKADDGDLDDVEEARETLEEQDLTDDDDNSNPENKVLSVIDLAVCDDMDFTLTFLDNVTYADLCQGGEPYIPAALRSVQQKPEDLVKSSEKPLITAPYSRIRNDTFNSSRSSITPPSSPTVRSLAPRLWTEEGRVTEISQDCAEEEEAKSDDIIPTEGVAEELVQDLQQQDSLMDGW